MALLDALRALTHFDPPAELPPCDLGELADVLDAHGLAPLASYQLENRPIGAKVPMPFRERLLPIYQGVVNDNVFRVLALKGLLRGARVPAVVLDGAAYVDWLYPHLAFRPVGDLRLAVRGEDGVRFAEAAAAAEFRLLEQGRGGHTAAFSDGRVALRIQEGLVAGREESLGLYDRTEPYPALGPTAARPAVEDALLVTVADVASEGLRASLLAYVDLRELLLRLPAERGAPLVERAAEAGLERALYGALALASHFFPEVADRAATLSPTLSRAERLAVDALVEAGRDPTQLHRLRGAGEAARLLLSPA